MKKATATLIDDGLIADELPCKVNRQRAANFLEENGDGPGVRLRKGEA